jgi:hypothetical protein
MAVDFPYDVVLLRRDVLPSEEKLQVVGKVSVAVFR